MIQLSLKLDGSDTDSKYLFAVNIKDYDIETHVLFAEEKDKYEIISTSLKGLTKDRTTNSMFTMYDGMITHAILNNKQIIKGDNHIGISSIYSTGNELADIHIAYYNMKSKLNSKKLSQEAYIKIIETLQFAILFDNGKFKELKDRINSIIIAYEL